MTILHTGREWFEFTVSFRFEFSRGVCSLFLILLLKHDVALQVGASIARLGRARDHEAALLILHGPIRDADEAHRPHARAGAQPLVQEVLPQMAHPVVRRHRRHSLPPPLPLSPRPQKNPASRYAIAGLQQPERKKMSVATFNSLHLDSAHGPLDLGLPLASLSAIDFKCQTRDQSDVKMIADTSSSECCCRIKCVTPGCPEAVKACKAERACVGGVMNAHKSWATLKAGPTWWTDAPGVEHCMQLDQKHRLHAAGTTRREWRSHHCNEFTKGDRLRRINNTSKLVFDIGFYDGQDTINMLELGHKVIAVEANPQMVKVGLQRPTAAVANRTGQLRVETVGITSARVAAGRPLTFYVHKTVSEWSSFKPNPQKIGEFRALEVPTTTCAALIEKYGVPYYMKIDIEGGDAACVHSLRRNQLPMYISTENPLLLSFLLKLGYRSFKMVSQVYTRRGSVQSSGGMPEDTPGAWTNETRIRAHPFWSEKHMHVRFNEAGGKEREEHDLHARLAS